MPSHGRFSGGALAPRSNASSESQRRYTNRYVRKPYGSGFGGLGASVHQLRTYVPFGGVLVDASIEVYNDQTAANVVLSKHAIAAGSDYTSITPTTAWLVGTENLALNGDAAFSAATPGVLQTAKQRIYMPPDVLDPKWSTLYTRTQQTGARGYGTNIASLWNTVATQFKQTLDFQTLTNINDPFTAPTTDQQLRSHSIIIEPVSAMKAMTAVIIGDSRGSGQGAGDATGTQPGCFGWFPRSIQAISAEFGDMISFENWAVPGSTSATFLQRFVHLLSIRAVDHVHYQSGSTNDASAWTEAVVTQCIANVARVEAECRRRGISFSTETMYPSVAATSDATVAQWHRLNDTMRSTYPGRVVDFAATALSDTSGTYPTLAVAYRTDTQHRNDAGNILSQGVAVPVLKKALGLSA